MDPTNKTVRIGMRPYRRKYHPTWRTRKVKGVVGEVAEYLMPFVHGTKVIWRLEPPFPLTAKICITVSIWFLLLLPLLYFFVPPLTTLFLLNCFSDFINVDTLMTQAGEFCARAKWLRRAVIPFRFLDRLTIAFFLYDYYQILKCLRSE